MAGKADRVCSKILAAGMAVFLTMALPNRVPAHSVRPMRIADASLCLDNMETDQLDDDQDATPIAMVMDGGCVVPDQAVST